MGKPKTPAKMSITRGSVAVGVVLALFGLLVTFNMRLFRDEGQRSPQDLPALIERQNTDNNRTQKSLLALQSEIDALSQGIVTSPVPTPNTQENIEAGTTALTGPGLIVQLWDAPNSALIRTGVQADDLVVHQQDVEAVINAMWAGGAEAMSIQDVRVTATTAVRCVGNTLLLQGRTYSPPYVIKAIGNPEKLAQSVQDSQSVMIYLEYVHAYGLGWSQEKAETIDIPASNTSGDLTYARVPSNSP